MPTSLAVLVAWGGLGLLVAIWFQTVGFRRYGAAATRGSVGFRLVILPALLLLWPLVLTVALRRDGGTR